MNKVKVENVGEDYVFTSVSPEGQIEREYKHISEFGVIKQLLADTQLLLQDRANDRKMVKDTLEQLNVIVPPNANPIHLLCKTLLQSKVILDSGDYVAVESVGGYITKANKIESVYEKSYVDTFERLLNGCHQVIDGEIVEDLEKLEQMEEL